MDKNLEGTMPTNEDMLRHEGIGYDNLYESLDSRDCRRYNMDVDYVKRDILAQKLQMVSSEERSILWDLLRIACKQYPVRMDQMWRNETGDEDE